MKPAPFRFTRPAELEEALALLSEHRSDAVPMAGGQSLTPLLNLRMARPGLVIDLSRIGALQTVAVEPTGVTLGSMCRARAAELDPDIQRELPVLQEALSYVGHPQIRNRGTIGGMVAFADPAAEIPAVLRACDGTVTLRSSSGAREVEAAEFFRGPYMTARSDDELVTALHFRAPADYRFVTVEHARRHGDFAIAGLVLGADLDGLTIRGLRICLFGVGPVPQRLTEVEQRFVGHDLDDATARAVAAAVAESVSPVSDVHGSADYRRHTASVITRRSLLKLTERSVSNG